MSWLLGYLLIGIPVVALRVAHIILMRRLNRVDPQQHGLLVWASMWLLWPLEASILLWFCWKFATAFASVYLTARRLARAEKQQ